MNTYAVIESGGKQYKVEKGTSLLVDRLSAKEGEKVSLRPVMFRDKEVVAGAKELEKVKVEATVAEHLRGKKIKVFKYKPKKGYRRRAGHRSELTKLEVTEVRIGTAARNGGGEERGAGPGESGCGDGEKAGRAAKKPAEQESRRGQKTGGKKRAGEETGCEKSSPRKKPRPKNRPRKPKPKSPTRSKPAAKKD